jgi:hypothetical protein
MSEFRIAVKKPGGAAFNRALPSIADEAFFSQRDGPIRIPNNTPFPSVF